MWNFWPWQRTERERMLEARIMELEAQLLGKELELANYALVLEHDKMLILGMSALAKERARISGVPDHVLDNAPPAQPLAPPPMRNGVHRG